MKDWEKILAERREIERIKAAKNEKDSRKETNDHENQRLERERQEAVHLAGEREERLARESTLLRSLGVDKMLEDINDLEWQGKGRVIPFEGRERYRRHGFTSSSGILGGYRSGGPAHRDYTFIVSGLELVFDYDTPNGKESTSIRVYLRYPEVDVAYHNPRGGFSVPEYIVNYDLNNIDRIFIQSGEEPKLDNDREVFIKNESGEETKRRYDFGDDSGMKGIPISIQDGLPIDSIITTTKLQYRLALECEARRNEKRTPDSIQNTALERIRVARLEEEKRTRYDSYNPGGYDDA